MWGGCFWGIKEWWARTKSWGTALRSHSACLRLASPPPTPGAGSLTIEKIRAKALSWRDVFVEIPITIHNSPLSVALMAEIEPPAAATQQDYDRCLPACTHGACVLGQGRVQWRGVAAVASPPACLPCLLAGARLIQPQHSLQPLSPCCAPFLPARLSLSIAPVLEKNMEFLNDCLDDLMVEQNKLSMWHQQYRRQQQQIAQYKLQRRQENQLRRAAGVICDGGGGVGQQPGAGVVPKRALRCGMLQLSLSAE